MERRLKLRSLRRVGSPRLREPSQIEDNSEIKLNSIKFYSNDNQSSSTEYHSKEFHNKESRSSQIVKDVRYHEECDQKGEITSNNNCTELASLNTKSDRHTICFENSVLFPKNNLNFSKNLSSNHEKLTDKLLFSTSNDFDKDGNDSGSKCDLSDSDLSSDSDSYNTKSVILQKRHYSKRIVNDVDTNKIRILNTYNSTLLKGTDLDTLDRNSLYAPNLVCESIEPEVEAKSDTGISDTSPLPQRDIIGKTPMKAPRRKSSAKVTEDGSTPKLIRVVEHNPIKHLIDKNNSMSVPHFTVKCHEKQSNNNSEPYVSPYYKNNCKIQYSKSDVHVSSKISETRKYSNSQTNNFKVQRSKSKNEGQIFGLKMDGLRVRRLSQLKKKSRHSLSPSNEIDHSAEDSDLTDGPGSSILRRKSRIEKRLNESDNTSQKSASPRLTLASNNIYSDDSRSDCTSVYSEVFRPKSKVSITSNASFTSSTANGKVGGAIRRCVQLLRSRSAVSQRERPIIVCQPVVDESAETIIQTGKATNSSYKIHNVFFQQGQTVSFSKYQSC